MVQLSTIRKPTWTYSALAAATILVVLAAIYQPYAGLLLALLAIVLVPLLLVAARAEHRVAPTTRRRGSRRGQFPTGPYRATSRPLASL
ncbi:MAG: hypothetical protein HC893_14325 [Chloroflexaceae bacterium]|nr:hypothetical protein [Chloroflexaceae bacterium]